VHGALALVCSFFFLAGLYAMLVAHLVAVLQILVYAGAIVVLFLFVIMLLNIQPEELGHPRPTLTKGAGLLAVLALLASVVPALLTSPEGQSYGVTLPVDTQFGSIESVGQLMYSNHLVPFELTSILLLVAIVGALVMAKRRL
jgi:NADH-quinone oxidoreductase subunit J